MANKNNVQLRSKLNCNKGDFERLRHLGQAEGLIGADLEKKFVENDQTILEIVNTKKEAHKGLIEIRDIMKCEFDEN